MSISYDQEFDQLRNEYLEHIVDLNRSLENVFQSGKIDSENFKEVFRTVHNIKGGAATHELTSISAICHYFEDFLANKLEKDLSNETLIKSCLKFSSIIDEMVSKLQNNEEVILNKYLDEISQIHTFDLESASHYKGNILVVDNTATLGNLLKKSLQSKGYHCTFINNGLTAFNRLVTQKFDALITSLNLDQLDGISLLSALKSTNNINANIPTLVISASKNVSERFPKDIKPDEIVNKDEGLINNLNTALENIFINAKQTQAGKGPTRILYVEDDPKMQKLMSLSLKKEPSISLSLAHDLESAQEAVKNSRPDIILLDNFLKNTSGEEVFFSLLDESIPTLFLTASESSVPVKKLKKHREFLGIITKPFRPGAIYGQIKRFYNDR